MEPNVRYVVQPGGQVTGRQIVAASHEHYSSESALENHHNAYNSGVQIPQQQGNMSQVYGGRFAAYREPGLSIQVPRGNSYNPSPAPSPQPNQTFQQNSTVISQPQSKGPNTPVIIGHQDVSNRHSSIRPLLLPTPAGLHSGTPGPTREEYLSSLIQSDSSVGTLRAAPYYNGAGIQAQTNKNSPTDEKLELSPQTPVPSLTSRQTIATVNQPSADSLTPRNNKEDLERSSRPADRSSEQRVSADLSRSSAEADRANATKLSTEISNLLKEREKGRAQPEAASNTFPSGFLTDLSRQNNEIMKERDVIRTQFEELSNRYQVLQRTLRVLEEQVSAEHEKTEHASKKLKDSEANALSLQNHHTVLARENQLLKEQLGKLLRLHETEKQTMQIQTQSMEEQLSAEQKEKADIQGQVTLLSQRIHSNEAQLKSREEVVKATSYALDRYQHRMQRTAALFAKRTNCSKYFLNWQNLSDSRKQGASRITAAWENSLLRVFVCEWSRMCRIEDIEKRMASDRARLQASCDEQLSEARKLLEEKCAAHNQVVETLKREYASMEDAFLKEAKQSRAASEERCQQLELKRIHEIEALKNETQSLAAATYAEHLRLLSEREQEHQKALENRDSQHCDQIAQKDAEWSHKFEVASEVHKNEISDVTARLETMCADHEANWTRKYDEACSMHNLEISDLKSRHESLLAQKDAEWAHKFDETLAAHANQISDLTARFEETISKQEAEWVKKFEGAQKQNELEQNSKKSQFERIQAEKEAEWEKKLEDSRSFHELEISNLTSRFEGIHAELREKLLSTRTTSNQHLEQLREEQSKIDREWRQKLIDKERSLAAHLEDMERQRTQSIEEIQNELQDKEKEWIVKMEAHRAEFAKAQEEWRQKMLTKDRDYASKMEATREANIKAQEDFQNELQTRDAEFKRILESKEVDCQALLEAHLSKASASTLELLQSKLSMYEANAKDREEQINLLKSEKSMLQSELQSISGKEQELLVVTEELKFKVKSFDDVSTKVGVYEDQILKLQQSMQALEQKYNMEKQKASTLSVELETASQALIKRGDDFSQSIKTLESILESKDSELKEANEKLKNLSSTNAALSAEVDTSSSASLSFKDTVAALQKELENAQRDKQKQDDEWHARFVALQMSSKSEIESARIFSPFTSQPNPDFQQKLQQAETELEHLHRILGSLQQENSTLTNELDNVLLENAQMRNKIDTLQFSDEGQRASQIGNASHSSFPSGPWGADFRKRMTAGVHGPRLLRLSFGAWRCAIMEIRMWGKNHTFNGLDNFIAADGGISDWFPVGRVRKSDFEVKSDKIGSGSFAEVLRGELKIPCAIKRIKGPVQQAELLEFVREGEMMRAVNHPSVVKLIGVHSENGQYNLLLEFVAGPNLFDYLHKHRKTLPINKQLSIAVQICDALACIHELRILHRDVKTQNIIYVEKSGTVKLCDFGLARLMPFGVTTIDPKHCGTGGTPAYQGPEILKRLPIGLKLDLYGFAISLWEIYCAKLPWTDCSFDQMTVRVAVLKERPRIPPEMPREYSEIIQRCWHDDPNSRPEFADLLKPLKELYESFNPSARLTMSASSTASTIFGSAGSSGHSCQHQIPSRFVALTQVEQVLSYQSPEQCSILKLHSVSLPR